jgi:hypothetical protein
MRTDAETGVELVRIAVTGRVAGLLVAALVVSGCATDPLLLIAKDISDARHPLIERIEPSTGERNGSGSPMIQIRLKAGATEADGLAIACDLVNPAIQRGDPPEALQYYVYNATGALLSHDRTPCHTASGAPT